MNPNNDKWPAVRASIRFIEGPALDARAEKEIFCHDLGQLFDRLQSASEGLDEVEKARCGLDGVAVEVVLQIDLIRRRYCWTSSSSTAICIITSSPNCFKFWRATIRTAV